MTAFPHGRVAVIAGDAHPALAAEVARLALARLVPATISTFADGETRVRIEESVEGSDVYLIQPTSSPVNDHLMALALLADSARGADASRVTAVMPYFGYARQDVRSRSGEPRSAALAARLLRLAGVDRLVVLDIHTPSLENAFDGPFLHLAADEALLPVVSGWDLKELTVVSPDAGGMKRAQRFAAALSRPIAMVVKSRPCPGIAVSRQVLGDVAGRVCLIVDDMTSTGGTVAAAAQALVQAGAREVRALFVHAAMTPGALARMLEAPVRAIVTTDSVPPPVDPRVRIVTVAPLLAKAIYALSCGRG